MKRRKITYRLYPSKQHTAFLAELLAYHHRIYTMALEERIECYQKERRNLSYSEQCKILTSWRKQNSGLNKVNAQSLQVTLKRLDLAFQGFFRRLRNGETPGFPRFKPLTRFKGWGYKTHGDGWRVFTDEKMRHGQLRLSGVGTIKMRGKARIAGEPKTCEIIHKQNKWYVSITIECMPIREGGSKAVGIDWGVENFLTQYDSDENNQIIQNPRYLKKSLAALKLQQQSIARKKNKKSHRRKKAVACLAKQHAKIANQRKNFIHQVSAKLVKEYGLIAVEELSIKKMTQSGGNRKSGLNREILNTAPAAFHALLLSKAEEAGIIYVKIPTKKVKPSQTCFQCLRQEKKTLAMRWHECDCGASLSRDENSARVILNWALRWAMGQELAEVGSCRNFATLNQETPAIPL